MWDFLWLPVWLFSAFGLGVLGVYNHHRSAHSSYLVHNDMIDNELAKQSVIGTMRASQSAAAPASVAFRRARTTFRMGDYMLHVLPLAVKHYWNLPKPAATTTTN